MVHESAKEQITAVAEVVLLMEAVAPKYDAKALVLVCLSYVNYERGCRLGRVLQNTRLRNLGIDEAIELRYATLDVDYRWFLLDPTRPEQSDNAWWWNNAIIQRGKMLLDE
jgi:hypothetical protein